MTLGIHDPTLSRVGVYLEFLRNAHAELLFKSVQHNKTFLSEWMPWAPKTTNISDTKNFIKTRLDAFINNEEETYVLRNLKDDHIIGCIDIHEYNSANLSASIGYWLAEEYNGRGIMTHVCQVFIQHLFSSTHLRKLKIQTAILEGVKENYKSSAIPIRLGFELEYIMKDFQLLNGVYYDFKVFTLFKKNYENKMS